MTSCANSWRTSTSPRCRQHCHGAEVDISIWRTFYYCHATDDHLVGTIPMKCYGLDHPKLDQTLLGPGCEEGIAAKFGGQEGSEQQP